MQSTNTGQYEKSNLCKLVLISNFLRQKILDHRDSMRSFDPVANLITGTCTTSNMIYSQKGQHTNSNKDNNTYNNYTHNVNTHEGVNRFMTNERKLLPPPGFTTT
ncbi:6548_t:CDS:1, partial [Ambispora gerdemannii]